MDPLFQPFEPPTARGTGKRLRRVPVRVLLPNMVTLLALCSGLTAIRLALEGRFEFAVAAILVAAALDAIDGRVARLLKSTSRFGAELDSLSDFVNFGVAPAIVLFVWTLDDVARVGWIAVLVFAIAAALRLARFNAALDDPDRPAWQADFFVGVPAPAGALVVLLPLYLSFVGVPRVEVTGPVVALYVTVVAFLLVSRIPTWSGKRLGQRISRDLVAPLFVATVIVAALLATFTFTVLTVGTLIYLATLPLSALAWRRRLREDRDGARPLAGTPGVAAHTDAAPLVQRTADDGDPPADRLH